MIHTTIDARGVDELMQSITVYTTQLPEKMVDAMRSLEPTVAAEVRKDFDVGGRPPGGPWAANAKATSDRKGHSQVLVGIGEGGTHMRDEFVYETERDGNVVNMWVSNTKMSPRNSAYSIWRIHYDGYKNELTGRDVVKRQSGTLADEAMEDVADKLMEYA